MNLQTIRQVAREDIAETSASFMSDAYIDRQANIAYKIVMAFILKSQGYRNTSIQESTTDLISTDGLVAEDVGYNGEYPLPTDCESLERLEVSYDGESFVPAEFYHLSSNTRSEFVEDDINAIATEDSPIIRLTRNSIMLRPVKTTAGDIAGGLHLWYSKREADMVLTTDVPNFKEEFHMIIPTMVANAFFKRKRDTVGQASTSRDIEELKRELKTAYQRETKQNKSVNPIQDNMK